jgi:hypothetical protein
MAELDDRFLKSSLAEMSDDELWEIKRELLVAYMEAEANLKRDYNNGPYDQEHHKANQLAVRRCEVAMDYLVNRIGGEWVKEVRDNFMKVMLEGEQIIDGGLIPHELYEQMQRNHKVNLKSEGGVDFTPVVKLFVTLGGNATWLLTEVDENDIAFGLCDLSQGWPELGYVDLKEISKVMGTRLEFDRHFNATAKLSTYARYARAKQRIETDLPYNYERE